MCRITADRKIALMELIPELRDYVDPEIGMETIGLIDAATAAMSAAMRRFL